MKRRAIHIVVLLMLGGAIMNIAVVWGAALRRSSIVIERNELGHFVLWNRPWQIVQEQRLGMTDVWWYDMHDENLRSTPPDLIVAEFNRTQRERVASREVMMRGSIRKWLAQPPMWGTFGEEPLSGDIMMGGDIAFGWPCRSLWMSTTCDVVNRTTVNDQLHGGWLIRGTPSARGHRFVALPYRMLWPGFAINTIFYAAMLWGVFFVPGMVRRRIRRMRGQCPACAYPIGTSPVCTECGAAVKQKAETQKAEIG